MIKNYTDFITALLESGFSVANGGNDEGVFSLLTYGWNEPGNPLRWHTGDPDTDPWEWRMRVLDERDDIAYAKVFFRKAGYITKEWYPYFLAARRDGKTAEEEYVDGTLSHFAKRIYEAVADSGRLPLHEIKQAAACGRADKAAFDTALTELQMKLCLTMCGRQQKISQKGEEYGWSSTVFCTTEMFWGPDVFEKAANIDRDEAVEKITERVCALNPTARDRKIEKFIRG